VILCQRNAAEARKRMEAIMAKLKLTVNAQTMLSEMANDAIGAAGLAEQFENESTALQTGCEKSARPV
jgi:hypothetical protein